MIKVELAIRNGFETMGVGISAGITVGGIWVGTSVGCSVVGKSATSTCTDSVGVDSISAEEDAVSAGVAEADASVFTVAEVDEFGTPPTPPILVGDGTNILRQVCEPVVTSLSPQSLIAFTRHSYR